MSEFYEKLIEELKNDPLNIGYARMSDSEAAMALSVKNRKRVIDRFISLRALAAVLEPDEYIAVKNAINILAQNDPRVEDMLEFLKMPCDDTGTTGGINFGHPAVRMMIDALPGVEDTVKEKMKALAEVPCARWEEIGLEFEPNQWHIRSAREMLER